MTGVFWFFLLLSFFFLPSREQRREKNYPSKDPLRRHRRRTFSTTFGRGGIDIWKLLVAHTTPSHRRRRHHLAVSGASLRGDQNQRPHECVQLKKINKYIPAATRARRRHADPCDVYFRLYGISVRRRSVFPIARAHLWRRGNTLRRPFVVHTGRSTLLCVVRACRVFV